MQRRFIWEEEKGLGKKKGAGGGRKASAKRWQEREEHSMARDAEKGTYQS